MGILAPLSSGRFQRLVTVFGRDSQPWHCHGTVNCLLTSQRAQFRPAPNTLALLEWKFATLSGFTTFEQAKRNEHLQSRLHRRLICTLHPRS